MVESACLQELTLLEQMRDALDKLANPPAPIQEIRTIKDWQVRRNGDLFELKRELAINTAYSMEIPAELMDGVEVQRIAMYFSAANARDVTINFIPGHVSGSVYERMYTVTTEIAQSILIVFGRDYQYTNLRSVNITTANGTAGDKIYTTVTLRKI